MKFWDIKKLMMPHPQLLDFLGPGKKYVLVMWEDKGSNKDCSIFIPKQFEEQWKPLNEITG